MFTRTFDTYAIPGDSISCEIDGFVAVATIYPDDCRARPDERNDGFWPSHDPHDAGYVPSYLYDDSLAQAKRVMSAWEADDWFYCGVAVTIHRAGVKLTGKYSNALWGLECNYPETDNDYLTEVANDLLKDALDEAHAKLVLLTVN